MNKVIAGALACLASGKNPYKPGYSCLDMASKREVIKQASKIAKENIDADAEIAMMILAGLEQPAESDAHKIAAELLKQHSASK